MIFINLFSSCDKDDAPVPPVPKDSTKAILSFTLTQANGALLDTNDLAVSIKQDSILVGVPAGTDLTALLPQITWKGVMLTPSAFDVQNFSTPVTYTVKAEDTSSRKYVVVVTHLPIRNRLFVGGSNNKFYALNALTGKLLWEFTSTKPFSYSSPAFRDSVVYVGGIDNYVYAFHAITGKVLWKFLTGTTGIEASVTIDGNTVYVGCNDDIFYALDAQTGLEKWRYNTGSNISTGAVVVNGTVYFGCSDSKVYALNASTGMLKWSYTTGGMIGASGPAVTGDVLYVGSRDNYLYAINATTGAFIWKYATGVSLEQSSATVQIGIVYIAGWYDVPGFTKKGSVYAVNAATGTLLWEKLANTGFGTSPAVANGHLYISGDDGTFQAINAASGNPAWSKQIYTNGANATIANGLVFIGGGGSGGYFYAYDATTGAFKWQFSTNNTSISFSGPLVLDSQGKAHYSSNSGMVQ